MNRANRPVDQEADLTYSKAAKAELARDYDLAFRLYVKAAELFLHLSRSGTGTQTQAAKWKASAGKALQRAEKIKAFVDKQKGQASQHSAAIGSPSTESNVNLTPIGIDHFSIQEQAYVLRKGGSVNGLYFPLWDEPVACTTRDRSPLYEDPDGQPKLSPEQAKVSPVWGRVPIREAGMSLWEDRKILPQEILQHIVTDCSVCASISVCLEHSRRFNSNLAQATINQASKFNPSPNKEASAASGRYDFKIMFNGDWRRIIVDDRLPYHPVDGTLMCMSVVPSQSSSSTQRPTLWPSILEKGYMKLLGGYDFPGSNSSIDLHAIAGWIPEHIEIKGSSFEREKTWERIVEGFSSGHCVLTLGTGTNPHVSWRDVELLPSHSYAVIDVIEAEGARTLTVLDTWVNPNHENQAKNPSQVLQVPWSDVLNVFDGIYLSWDPTLWSRNLTFHGMWKRRGQDEQSSTRQVYLRFVKQNRDVEQEIWLLLTRHVTDSSRTSDFISLKVEVEDELRSASHVVDQTMIASKTYTNSTHVLMRTKVFASQPSGVLSIFTSYDGDAMEVGFTLNAYANSEVDISWDETIPTPPFTKQIEGVLTSKNAGGNCTYPTFMLNPQYYLQIHPPRCPPSASQPGLPKANVALTLQTSRDVPVNVSLAYSQGGRIDELVESELMASSGAYSYGLARVRKEIPPGDYTAILSAFEPHHMGSFSLKVDSSQPFDLLPIPQEGAGMYTKNIRGAWKSSTAVGGPSSDLYSKNPIFEIDVPSLTQLKIRLQLLRPFTPTSLNITIFPASSDGALRRHIATSGAYNDAISGVVTPQISLGPGKYWAVPSTYNPGVEAGFQLFVYTTVSGVRISQRP